MMTSYPAVKDRNTIKKLLSKTHKKDNFLLKLK